MADLINRAGVWLDQLTLVFGGLWLRLWYRLWVCSLRQYPSYATHDQLMVLAIELTLWLWLGLLHRRLWLVLRWRLRLVLVLLAVIVDLVLSG